jgi:hypothetical protein
MKSIQCSVAFAIFALSLTAGCGLENSVVGGRCRNGMQLSGNTCVAPDPGATLVTPEDPPIGTFGNHPGDPSPEGREIDPSRVDPPLSPSAPLSPIAPPYTPPVDVPPPPVLPPPPLVCAAPLIACHDACIPVDSDPMNCGACGKVCASNICVAGECQGATPGDVVLIGHDFTYANNDSAQTRVFINALSIPTTDPIRVLSYENGAPALSVSVVRSVATYGIKNREIRFTTATAASDLASATLGKDYDIVLLHDASAGNAATIGASWAASLDTFTRKGGVVVALDNGTSPMSTLLSSSGMLTVTSHTTLPSSTHLLVTGAADVVGAQVLSPYAAFGSAVSFQGLAAQSADLTWVVRAKNFDDSAGDAVVVHRVVRDAD